MRTYEESMKIKCQVCGNWQPAVQAYRDPVSCSVCGNLIYYPRRWAKEIAKVR